MTQHQLEDQVRFQGKSLIISQIATFIVCICPLLGGTLYIAGSIVYWPTLTNVSPSAGGILFTLGSIVLVMADIAFSYLEPQFCLLTPFKNIGCFRASCLFIGNVMFTVGSIYFLPNFPVVIGDDLFVIGSIFQFIPQILSIWGVCTLNLFTAPFYKKMIRFKKTIVIMNICLAFGCFCFFVGTILFENQNFEPNSLYEQGVVMFILGSFCFFVGPLLALKMRKNRIFDPLARYHDQLHNHYTPKQHKAFLFQLNFQKTLHHEEKIEIHVIQPSIIR